jgi:hypothetical protein
MTQIESLTKAGVSVEIAIIAESFNVYELYVRSMFRSWMYTEELAFRTQREGDQ